MPSYLLFAIMSSAHNCVMQQGFSLGPAYVHHLETPVYEKDQEEKRHHHSLVPSSTVLPGGVLRQCT